MFYFDFNTRISGVTFVGGKRDETFLARVISKCSANKINYLKIKTYDECNSISIDNTTHSP